MGCVQEYLHGRSRVFRFEKAVGGLQVEIRGRKSFLSYVNQNTYSRAGCHGRAGCFGT